MRRTSLLLAALAVLSACTVTVDEGNPPPRPRPGMCPKIFQPVCGERGGARQTFPNDCVAFNNGFRVLYDGQCRRDPPPPPPGGGGVVCPMNYQPVCGRQGGVLRTFPNACVAGASGFTVIDDGEC